MGDKASVRTAPGHADQGHAEGDGGVPEQGHKHAAPPRSRATFTFYPRIFLPLLLSKKADKPLQRQVQEAQTGKVDDHAAYPVHLAGRDGAVVNIERVEMNGGRDANGVDGNRRPIGDGQRRNDPSGPVATPPHRRDAVNGGHGKGDDEEIDPGAGRSDDHTAVLVDIAGAGFPVKGDAADHLHRRCSRPEDPFQISAARMAVVDLEPGGEGQDQQQIDAVFQPLPVRCRCSH